MNKVELPLFSSTRSYFLLTRGTMNMGVIHMLTLGEGAS